MAAAVGRRRVKMRRTARAFFPFEVFVVHPLFNACHCRTETTVVSRVVLLDDVVDDASCLLTYFTGSAARLFE
jgi:hypothetical protein